MNNGFVDAFISTTSGDGRIFTLLAPLVYVTKNGEVVTVPAGTPTDGASTPAGLWVTIPPFGKYWLAAILHDYLYRFTSRPKDECDNLLLEAMESLGVDEIEAHTIYEGVHLFGQAAFDEDRRV
ncbi:MAG: DUF1353 domain-containing protein [Dehalococcoidia bacterium]|jgi:hypothetical protein